MDRSVLLGALLVLVANVSFCQAQTVEKYFKAGGKLELSPQPVSAPITSIVWKYDKNLLAEWVKDSIELTYYSKFKDRTTLNTDTGVLGIRDLTAADTGLYSVEINNQVQPRVYRTVEIEDVPQPKVEVKPLGCNSASESCKLVCDGDVSAAGPVEYFWKKDDGQWEKSEINTREIMNDEETQRVKTFTCRMKNLFSEKGSTGFKNRFYKEKTPESEPSSGYGVIVVATISALVVLAAAGLAVWKRETLKQKIPCLNCSAPNQPAPTASKAEEGKELLEVKPESNPTANSPPINNGHKPEDAGQPNAEDTDTS